MSLVNVYNEWDPLEEIIVGSALNAFIPDDKSFKVMQRSTPDLFAALQHGNLPKRIIDETEEDIQQFIAVLEKLNITVKRPSALAKPRATFQTLHWQSQAYFPYCPRDTLLAIGTWLIETPNVFRSRYFETMAYKDILIDYMMSGTNWIAAPKPALLDNLYNAEDDQGSALRNLEPVFDAANILRAGEDIFYLVSDSGNELGLQWLQQVLGPSYRIHPCYNLYSSLHVDSTISLLRPGLALINPSRVNEKNLPPLLRQWECIEAPDMVEYCYSDSGFFSTKWLGMNLLMLSPNLAVVDTHQIALINLLEKKQIDVIPLLLRHGRTLGGGFHCITLDVRRKSKLESYFSGACHR